MNLAFKYLLKNRSKLCSKDQSSQQTTFSTYTTSEDTCTFGTSCLLGNRKVPKLARLQRIFPASIQLTTSSFGVKDRDQSTLYGGPQLSRQNQKPHDKTENLTAKPKTSRQNRKTHGKNKIPHGKTENLTAKTKSSQQNQKPHGKTKYFTTIPHFILSLFMT